MLRRLSVYVRITAVAYDPKQSFANGSNAATSIGFSGKTARAIA